MAAPQRAQPHRPRAGLRPVLLAALCLLACAARPLAAPVDDGDDERLPGWQGERLRAAAASSARNRTKGERDGADDLARGMWLQTISWRPRAMLVHNFMTKEEAADMITLATPHMERSMVIDSVTGESKEDPIRTSMQTFLNRWQYPLVTKLEERIARLVQLPVEHGEDMQARTREVLRYGLGQKYDAHHDVGELDSASGALLAADGGQRVATALLYLTDVEEGGETAFPDSRWADPALSPGPWSACADGGVAARARVGQALIFWSITPDNEIDPASMHAGCPVIKGTKWIHAKPFRWSTPPPPADPNACEDSNAACRMWAKEGECEKNPGFMTAGCKLACKLCPE